MQGHNTSPLHDIAVHQSVSSHLFTKGKDSPNFKTTTVVHAGFSGYPQHGTSSAHLAGRPQLASTGARPALLELTVNDPALQQTAQSATAQQALKVAQRPVSLPRVTQAAADTAAASHGVTLGAAVELLFHERRSHLLAQQGAPDGQVAA